MRRHSQPRQSLNPIANLQPNPEGTRACEDVAIHRCLRTLQKDLMQKFLCYFFLTQRRFLSFYWENWHKHNLQCREFTKWESRIRERSDCTWCRWKEIVSNLHWTSCSLLCSSWWSRQIEGLQMLERALSSDWRREIRFDRCLGRQSKYAVKSYQYDTPCRLNSFPASDAARA